MQKVILIGDSIRAGYEKIVRRELAPLARVHVPRGSGGDSQRTLEHLEEWIITQETAVVHLNCGLHDLKKEFGADENAVPLAQYQTNLRHIMLSIQRHTQAIPIWATTTPVIEKWHHQVKNFDRFEADVRAYNKAALDSANACGIPVNDLFAAMCAAGPEHYLLADGVHFTEAGSTLLGKAVSASIKKHLGPV